MMQIDLDFNFFNLQMHLNETWCLDLQYVYDIYV